jgi:nitrate/nitrite transporter NarK
MTTTTPPEPRPVPIFRLFYTFLPETSLLRQVRFQLVVASRALSEIGQEAVFYGALVAVAANPLHATLIAVAKAAPGALLGLIGGTVADALPRRIALGMGYGLQAAACLLVVLFLGTSFVSLLVLVAVVSTLNQLIGPSEKAVIPLVSARTQIATAAAILAIADSLGSGFGVGILAPAVMKSSGLDLLLFMCAAVLALASIRVFSLPLERDVGVRQSLRRLHLTEAELGWRTALQWLAGWPAIATMITAGVVVSVLNVTMTTLGPSYVSTTLATDPANAVYVFAPGSVAALLALVVGPALIDRTGERRLAAFAVLVQTSSLFSLALIDTVAPALAPISPANIMRVAGESPSDALLAASFISIFTGFSASLSSFAVQTYLNRRVPAIQQGRVFGAQSALANCVAMPALLALGSIAEIASIRLILFLAPWVVMVAMYALLILAGRMTGHERPRRDQVLASFWHEPDELEAPAAISSSG